jgi:hypothetical protein
MACNLTHRLFRFSIIQQSLVINTGSKVPANKKFPEMLQSINSRCDFKPSSTVALFTATLTTREILKNFELIVLPLH